MAYGFSPKQPLPTIKFPPLEEWQQPVFDDYKSELYDIQVIKAKRQVGKSLTCIYIALYAAFKTNNSISAIVEPTLAQGRRVYKQLLKSIGGESSPLVRTANSTLLEIEFSNGSQIIFKSAEQGEQALRGLTVKKGVLIIDEGAFIDDAIYEVLYPTVDATRSKIIIVSTPLFESGEFYKKYMEGLPKGPGRPSKYRKVKSYNWSKYDTSKYLSEEKLEYYRERLSPLRFRSEYEGEFIKEGSYVMGNLDSIIGLYSTSKPKFGGLDWGNGGENDFTVMILLDAGGNVTGIYPKNNLQPSEQIEYFSTLINAQTLQALQVETNSIGTVYMDLLQGKTTTYIQGFNTSNESKRRIIEQLISAIQQHLITIPNDPELIKQLQHFNIEKTKTGYTYNGNGAHDDYVIALALAYDAYLNNAGGFEITYA